MTAQQGAKQTFGLARSIQQAKYMRPPLIRETSRKTGIIRSFLPTPYIPADKRREKIFENVILSKSL